MTVLAHSSISMKINADGLLVLRESCLVSGQRNVLVSAYCSPFYVTILSGGDYYQ